MPTTPGLPHVHDPDMPLHDRLMRGWGLLATDTRIRYRAQEFEALQQGPLFCLVSGNMNITEIIDQAL